MISPLVIAAVAPSIAVSAFNTQQVGRSSTALNKFKKVRKMQMISPLVSNCCGSAFHRYMINN